jgi:hypothetical protein
VHATTNARPSRVIRTESACALERSLTSIFSVNLDQLEPLGVVNIDIVLGCGASLI